MPLTLQPDGSLRGLDSRGTPMEIAPSHPDYQRYRAHHQRVSTAANAGSTGVRAMGGALALLGMAAIWYNFHLMATMGQYYIKLGVFGPFALCCGLVVAIFPESSGPVRPDSTKAHKMAMAIMLTLSGLGVALNYYLLSHYRP